MNIFASNPPGNPRPTSSIEVTHKDATTLVLRLCRIYSIIYCAHWHKVAAYSINHMGWSRLCEATNECSMQT